MPVHIEEMETDISVAEGEMPLSPRQFEAIVSRVVKRLRESEQKSQLMEEASRLQRSAAPRSPVR